MADEQEFQDTIAKFEAMETAEGRPALPPVQEALPLEEAKPPEPAMEGQEAGAPPPEKTESQKLEDEFVEFTGKQKERFNKVYGRMRQLERQNSELLRTHAGPIVGVDTPPPPQPVQQFSKSKPQLSQFEDADKWADAISDWSSEKAQFESIRTVEQRFAQNRATAQAQEQMQQHSNFINSKVDEGRGRFKEFDEVSEDLAAVSSEFMVNQIFKLNRFSDVVMELGKNLPEAERIARLSPEDAVYELKSLERKISSREELAKKQQAKTPTKVETPGEGVATTSPTTAKLRQEAIKSGSLRDFAKVFEAMDHSA